MLVCVLRLEICTKERQYWEGRLHRRPGSLEAISIGGKQYNAKEPEENR